MHIDTGSGLELTVVAPGVVRGHRSHVSTHIFLPSTCPFPLLVYRQWFCGKIVYGLVQSFVHAYSKFHSSPDCGGVIRDHKETHVARREPRTTKSLVAECTSPFFLNLRYMLLNLSSPFLRAHCMDARTIISLSFFFLSSYYSVGVGVAGHLFCNSESAGRPYGSVVGRFRRPHPPTVASW